MSEPTDIGSRRFERARYSDEVKPRDALAGVIREIDSGSISPDHVIIVMRTGVGPEATVEYAQAGDADLVMQLGMVARFAHMVQR